MAEFPIEDVLNGLLDKLAAIEHERWGHWQRYMHEKAQPTADGSLVIPQSLVERWERQMNTPFEQLSEDERESDREQVRRYLPIISQELVNRLSERVSDG